MGYLRWTVLVSAWLLPTAGADTPTAGADTCSTAGVGRAAFRDRNAVQWMAGENERRAPYYLKQARKMYEKGVRQKNRIDKTNSDPFIATYDAQHQVLGAIDLAPNNASIWLGAGQATSLIASLDEDKQSKMAEAMKFFGRACTMDPKQIDVLIEWASKKESKDETKDVQSIKKVLKKKAEAWKKDPSKVPKGELKEIFPVLVDRMKNDVCMQGAPMSSVDKSDGGEHESKKSIKAAVAGMTVRPIFPTLITTVNVKSYFPAGFVEKLASTALKRYSSFSKDKKKKGDTDANDINDAFFSAQFTSEAGAKSQQAQKFWPELYNSKEYGQLMTFMKEALIEHATKSGYELTPEAKAKAHMVIWSAVYLEDGGRHGYHVHQGSLSSCVFYAQSSGAKTPIMFVDPRGAQPTNDYEQHLGERDFEPNAPFHHNYHFFAEAGDLVCFPSWLVHRVPSHFEKDARVAFPANLQGDSMWDSWYRSATLP